MITLDLIKTALKIETTYDDQDLLRLRDAVISLVENHTGLSLCPRQQQQYLGSFVRTRIEGSPFISVDSVKYTSTGGTLTTMPSADWFISRKDSPSVFIDFLREPSIKDGTEIEVTYQVGYGQVPADLQHAIIALIGTFYENPSALQLTGGSGPLPMGAEFILQNLKVRSSLS
jgi:uncharacterized phiE125 gp8 family phage protein